MSLPPVARKPPVTARTVLHASKLPLTTWFSAVFLMATL